MDTPDTIGPADGPYMLAGSLDYSSFVIPANVERYAVAITQPQMTLEQFTDKCADIVSFCQGILAVAEKIYGLKGCEDQPLRIDVSDGVLLYQRDRTYTWTPAEESAG